MRITTQRLRPQSWWPRVDLPLRDLTRASIKNNALKNLSAWNQPRLRTTKTMQNYCSMSTRPQPRGLTNTMRKSKNHTNACKVRMPVTQYGGSPCTQRSCRCLTQWRSRGSSLMPSRLFQNPGKKFSPPRRFPQRQRS